MHTNGKRAYSVSIEELVSNFKQRCAGILIVWCCYKIVSRSRRSTNYATTRRNISHVVHSKSCTCKPCKDRYIMVYIHTLSWCNQNPTWFLVWIHKRVECRSWWTTHSLHSNLEQPYNIQMHFTRSLKQQKSTTKGPSYLIKFIHAKGPGKSWGFDYAHKMPI
jgi:hypothetical protein